MHTMLDRPLIALDGSRASEVALTYLEPWLAHAQELLLLHVVAEDLEPAASVAVDGEHEGIYLAGDDDGASARRYLASTKDRFADALHATYLVEAGRVAESILEASARENATLVAMATHGRGGLAQWALGSQTERVLRASKVPVLVVPSRLRTEALPTYVRHVLVPVDGSERALALVPHVKSLTRMDRVQVTLAHFVSPHPTPADIDRGETFLFRARCVFEDAGMLPLTKIVRAHAAPGIVAYALPAVDDELPVDLIAMTTHGRSGVMRWALGSVTEKVIRHSHVPLLVVRSDRPD